MHKEFPVKDSSRGAPLATGFRKHHPEGSSLEPFEDHLYRFAGAQSAVLGKVADEIEAQLGAWRGEKGE